MDHNFLEPKILWTQNFFVHGWFLEQKVFGLNLFLKTTTVTTTSTITLMGFDIIEINLVE